MSKRCERWPSALVVMGVSGSGKSTIGLALARRLKWPFEDGDSFHPPANVEKLRAGHPLTDNDRAPWLAAIAAEITRVDAAGGHVVVACSALKRRYRDILRGEGNDLGFVYLTGDRHLIAGRMIARVGHFMPVDLLQSQFEALEEPEPGEGALAVDIAGSVTDTVDRIVEGLRDRYRKNAG